MPLDAARQVAEVLVKRHLLLRATIAQMAATPTPATNAAYMLHDLQRDALRAASRSKLPLLHWALLRRAADHLCPCSTPRAREDDRSASPVVSALLAVPLSSQATSSAKDQSFLLYVDWVQLFPDAVAARAHAACLDIADTRHRDRRRRGPAVPWLAPTGVVYQPFTSGSRSSTPVSRSQSCEPPSMDFSELLTVPAQFGGPGAGVRATDPAVSPAAQQLGFDAATLIPLRRYFQRHLCWHLADLHLSVARKTSPGPNVQPQRWPGPPDGDAVSALTLTSYASVAAHVLLHGVVLNGEYVEWRIRAGDGMVSLALQDLEFASVVQRSRNNGSDSDRQVQQCLHLLRRALDQCRQCIRAHPTEVAAFLWARLEPLTVSTSACARGMATRQVPPTQFVVLYHHCSLTGHTSIQRRGPPPGRHLESWPPPDLQSDTRFCTGNLHWARTRHQLLHSSDGGAGGCYPVARRSARVASAG